MGCLARLGCLVLIVILGAGGWLTRRHWLPERFRERAPAGAMVAWQPLTPTGADRTRTALTKLSEPSGQAFQTLTASDLASYAFRQLTPSVARAADSVQTRVIGESVAMRANVRVADLRASGALGSLAGLLHDREWVQLTGTFKVFRPGLAEFDVQDVQVGELTVPRGLIAALIERTGQLRPSGLPANALALPIPRTIGDIRVANGKVTLYKSMQ